MDRVWFQTVFGWVTRRESDRGSLRVEMRRVELSRVESLVGIGMGG